MHCSACGQETADIPCQRCGADPRLADRYRLLEEIGRGATGITWRAEDPSGRTCALKEMPLHGRPDAKRDELLRREVRVLRQLHHSSIPAYYEHFIVTEGRRSTLCLAQEHIAGRSLEQELDERRYAPREVAEVLKELAEILCYLHGLSPPVIHRDIKPANVLRRPDGRLCLADFGAVRDVLTSQLGGSTVAGTFGYMAPEQFAGDAEPASDLYGLGALAVRLLTRRQPQELLDRANQMNWKPHARLPAALTALLDRLLEPDTELRMHSAAALRRELEALLEAWPEGAEAPGVEAAQRAARSARPPQPYARERPELAERPPPQGLIEQPRPFEPPVLRGKGAAIAERPGQAAVARKQKLIAGLLVFLVVMAGLTLALFTSRPDLPAPTPPVPELPVPVPEVPAPAPAPEPAPEVSFTVPGSWEEAETDQQKEAFILHAILRDPAVRACQLALERAQLDLEYSIGLSMEPPDRLTSWVKPQ